MNDRKTEAHLENGIHSMEEPSIVHTKLITDTLIEIKFSQDVKNVDNISGYYVYIDGIKLSSEKYKLLPYFDMVITIQLSEPVNEIDHLIELDVQNCNICNENGVKLKIAGKYKVERDIYYKKRYRAPKSNIEIIGFETVQDNTIKLAGEMIDIMLSKRPDIAKVMDQCGAKLAVIAEGQKAFFTPELRKYYNPKYLYAEGFGGTINNPVTTATEINILRYVDSEEYNNVTRYKNESIVAHEFGHAIHLIGLLKGDQALTAELDRKYNEAKGNGLWPNTYAISNWEEYFATGTAIWFNVMSESVDGSFDGTRGPVNTREELKQYDPGLYNLLSKIYDEISFPSPWDHVLNCFDIHGSRIAY